jgi:hypothetical protein
MGVDRGRALVSRMPNVSAIFIEQRAGRGLTMTTAGRFHGLARLSKPT